MAESTDKKELEALQKKRLHLMFDFSESKKINDLHEKLIQSEKDKDFLKWQKIHNQINEAEKPLRKKREAEMKETLDRINELKNKQQK